MTRQYQQPVTRLGERVSCANYKSHATFGGMPKWHAIQAARAAFLGKRREAGLLPALLACPNVQAEDC